MNHPIYPSKHMSAQNNLECQRCISKMIVYTKYANQPYMMHMARDEIDNQYAVIMVSPVYPWDGKDDDNRESVFFDLVKDLLNDEMNFEWHASVLEAIETYVQSWSLAWMTTMKKMASQSLMRVCAWSPLMARICSLISVIKPKLSQ